MADDDAPLTNSFWTRLSDEERKRVRHAAVDLDIPESVLNRALWRYGLDRLEDPELRRYIDAETARLKASRRRAGQATARKRWGNLKAEGDPD